MAKVKAKGVCPDCGSSRTTVELEPTHAEGKRAHCDACTWNGLEKQLKPVTSNAGDR